MPRWGGWTSDLDQSAELFGRYYPECVEQMRVAAAMGRAPSPDPAVLGMLIVGRITDRPWAVDGRLALRKVVHLSLTFDHRVCDGGTAAGFLRHVAERIQG